MKIEDDIINWISFEKRDGVRPATIKNRRAGVKLFYEMNRKPLSWTVITKTIPGIGRSKDQAWERKQIKEMLPFANEGNQAIIDRHILSHDSKYCLIEEAWGFTGRHTGYYIAPLIPFIGCWTCVKYGRAMGKESKEKSNDTSNFRPLIIEFLKHWNEKQ